MRLSTARDAAPAIFAPTSQAGPIPRASVPRGARLAQSFFSPRIVNAPDADRHKTVAHQNRLQFTSAKMFLHGVVSEYQPIVSVRGFGAVVDARE